MALNSEQVRRLLTMIHKTREVELSCPECLDELDKYAQGVLDGAPLAGVLERVREHLEACQFCESEFTLILETFEEIDEYERLPASG
jgi:hypothetical protein